MWIIGIPLIFVLIAVLALGASISKALSINIMPFFSFTSLIFAIVGIVNFFRSQENDRKIHIVLAAISFILFLITLGATATTGDILSWIWHHI